MTRWLEVNGEPVYGTTYWSRMEESGELRLTVKQNHAFYITSLTDPGSSLAAAPSRSARARRSRCWVMVGRWTGRPATAC